MLRVSERTDRIEHVPRDPLPLAEAAREHRELDRREGRDLASCRPRRSPRTSSGCGIPAIARPNPSFPHRAIARSPTPRAALAARDRDRADEGRARAPRALPRVDLRALDVSRTSRCVLVDTGTTDPDALRLFERYPVDVAPVRRAVQLLAREQPRRRARRRRARRVPQQRHRGADARVARGAGRASPSATASARSGRCSSTRTGPCSTPASCSGCAGTADHIMRGFPGDADGYAGSLSLHARGLGGHRRLHGDPPRRCSTSSAAFDEHFAHALPGRRPLPAPPATPAAGTSSRRAPCSRHDESVTRGDRVRPPRPRAPPRRVGRDDRARRPVLQPAALALRRRLPTRVGGVNVVFVNYHDFTSNSAVHICNLANELAAARRSAARSPCPATRTPSTLLGEPAVPGARLPRRAERRAPLPGRRAADARPRLDAARARPRAHRGARARHRCPYVVHLEDNEDVITADRLGLTVDELRVGARRRLDAVDRADACSHPARMRRFLAGAARDHRDRRPAARVPAGRRPGRGRLAGVRAGALHRRPAASPSCGAALGIADDESVLVYAGNAHAVERGGDAQPLPRGRGREPRGPAAPARPARTRLRRVPRARAARRSTEHVVHVPLQPRSEVPRYVRLADVLVQPGRAGRLQRVPLPVEAARSSSRRDGRSSCPATNLGRYLEDGEECLLLRRGDALEIAAAVERLLDDDELRARLGRGGARLRRAHLQLARRARGSCAASTSSVLGGPASIAAAGDRRRERTGLPARVAAAGSSYATVRDYCDSADRLPQPRDREPRPEGRAAARGC